MTVPFEEIDKNKMTLKSYGKMNLVKTYILYSGAEAGTYSHSYPKALMLFFPMYKYSMSDSVNPLHKLVVSAVYH